MSDLLAHLSPADRRFVTREARRHARRGAKYPLLAALTSLAMEKVCRRVAANPPRTLVVKGSTN